MAKAEKLLCGLAAGLGALSAACLTVPDAVCRKLGAQRGTLDFAGQKPGAFLINSSGKSGFRAVACSTEYAPGTVERTGGKLAISAAGLLAAAAVVRALRR